MQYLLQFAMLMNLKYVKYTSNSVAIGEEHNNTLRSVPKFKLVYYWII